MDSTDGNILQADIKLFKTFLCAKRNNFCGFFMPGTCVKSVDENSLKSISLFKTLFSFFFSEDMFIIGVEMLGGFYCTSNEARKVYTVCGL